MIPFEKEFTVLSVEKKVSKKGNDFNLVTLAGLGFNFSTFLDERLVPDFLEGKTLRVKGRIEWRNGRPDVRILGVVE